MLKYIKCDIHLKILMLSKFLSQSLITYLYKIKRHMRNEWFDSESRRVMIL